ncbi:MAG: GIY-YIG nuclease family protein [Chitinophagaceae bacterium]
MYTVYILYSPTFNKIYVGYTSDLKQRLLSHNELSKKGWTMKFRPWVLVHAEVYEFKQEALLREKELKSGKGREWIWGKLIKASI